MIHFIVRVRYQDLFERLLKSIMKTCVTGYNITTEDDDGQPKLAESYNRLAGDSKHDVLVFVHDDIEFLEKGWDAKIIEALQQYDVAGVVGALDYKGGRIFDGPKNNWVGKFSSTVDDVKAVKLFSSVSFPIGASVVDGMFMAVRGDHFKKVKFDEAFDGLFFYDLDYCLRSKVCVADVLLFHGKPEKYWGKYPADMKPIEAYWDKFHEKHGLDNNIKAGDQSCFATPLSNYMEQMQVAI